MRDDRLRLAFLHLREIEHAQLREIDHEPFARCGRQHELRRQHDLASLAGHPRIDARVGARDFFVAEIEAPRDVRQRVLAHHLRHLQLADDFVVRSRW